MKSISFWLLSLPLSYFAVFLLFRNSAFKVWNDSLFVIGLLLLVTGCSMLVISGGFFNAFVHNWKTFFSAVNKKQQVIHGIEGKREHSGFRKEFRFSGLLIRFGIAYCIISFLLSLTLV